MTEKLSIDPSVVREFAAHGEGNFEQLKGLIDATHLAWAADYGNQGVVVTYSISLGSSELVDQILKAIEDSGYQVTKTRSRKIRGTGFIFPGEDWKDIADFQAVHRLKHNVVAACAVPGVIRAPRYQAIFLQPIE